MPNTNVKIFLTRAQYDLLLREKNDLLNEVLSFARNKRWSVPGMSMDVPESIYKRIRSYVKLWNGQEYVDYTPPTHEEADRENFQDLMKAVKAVLESGVVVNPVCEDELRRAFLKLGGKLSRYNADGTRKNFGKRTVIKQRCC